MIRKLLARILTRIFPLREGRSIHDCPSCGGHNTVVRNEAVKMSYCFKCGRPEGIR